MHDFKRLFHDMTDHEPFPWQEKLYDRLCAGQIPRVCDLPTGLGKTSVIAVWLLALAYHLNNDNSTSFPRRLVYVVNRRTVVDQTTDEVIQLKNRLMSRKELKELRNRLGGLAISTLRGQFADNQEWYSDPSRPALICGTVDMIGSRLLFGGYRIGFKARPLHAGFLGQDSLLVHDEAHLEPAFQKLIETIQQEQNIGELTGNLPWPKLRVMALSATARSDAADSATETLRLSREDYEFDVIAKRIHAYKNLQIDPIKEEKGGKLANKLIELAKGFDNSGGAVLIFSCKVNDVEKVAKKLPKGSTEQLTGTLRGLERDSLIKSPVFQRFLPESNRDAGVKPATGTVYLVCTSAGEVGVNISADHLICDLSTFDSMAQRFGRVNRFGDRDDTEIHVVYPEKFSSQDKLVKYKKETLALLQDLGENACPAALEKLASDRKIKAFSPEPNILAATDILFDAWSMTTIRHKMPGRPPVAPYLHGVAEWEPPRTMVAWREDVKIITDVLLDRFKPEDLLDDYPLKPHELLQDDSNRIHKKLQKIAERHPYNPVWLLGEDASVEVLLMKDLVDKNNKSKIYGCTILMPPSVGGLNAGTLDSKATGADDVADLWLDEKGRQRRIRLWDDEVPPADMSLVRTIDINPGGDEFESSDEDEDERGRSETRRFWHWYVRPRQAEGAARALEPPITLKHHTKKVVEQAHKFMDRLSLPDELKHAILLSAKLHDLGKRRELWQRSIGNPKPLDWYAKPGKPADSPRWRPRRLSVYRHELGSLLDMMDPDQQHFNEFNGLSCEMKDLVLHLVAAHHGRARPHFPQEELYDPAHGHDFLVREQALEIPRRFARLQRRYGRWGLAYLESLLRAADWAASAEPFLAREIKS